MNIIKRLIPVILAIFCSAIFLDSLRYKFTNHPNTQEIFGRLNEWAANLGAEGLFAQTGLFSQFRRLQGFGALLGLAVMTGAISFHLFTPLGIDPNNDGGGLFIAACMVWLSCLTLVLIRRKTLGNGLKMILQALFGKAA